VVWSVRYTDEFADWWETLTEDEQEDVSACVNQLIDRGRPYVDSVNGSRHSNMKELRTQSGGNPLRTFFVFDPTRSAILLIGGNKRGDKRFYDRMVPIADDLYDEFLNELKREGNT